LTRHVLIGFVARRVFQREFRPDGIGIRSISL
jgi:hypothetical protein